MAGKIDTFATMFDVVVPTESDLATSATYPARGSACVLLTIGDLDD